MLSPIEQAKIYASGFRRGFLGEERDGCARSLPKNCPAIVPGVAKTGEHRAIQRDAYIDGQAARYGA